MVDVPNVLSCENCTIAQLAVRLAHSQYLQIFLLPLRTMTDRPVKRVRASSIGDSATTNADPAHPVKLSKLIGTLDEKTVRNILLVAAQESPRVSSLIELESSKLINDAKTLDFGQHSKSVWRTLNVGYTKGIKDSRQFEMSGDAYQEVVTKIEDIRDRCPVHASYVTKYSALETLRKIGKIIIMSGDSTLGSEVRKSFSSDSIIEKTMQGIVKGMTTEERQDMVREPQGEMIWIDKLKDLEDLAAEYCVFEGLAGVILLFEGKGNDNAKSLDGVEVVDIT